MTAAGPAQQTGTGAAAAEQKGPGVLREVCIDVEGFDDSAKHDCKMLGTLCRYVCHTLQ